MKKRLDLLMVERALAPSREKAKAYIMSGDVYVDGQKEDKAGTMFQETVKIEVRGNTLPYVSRGGLKLEKAMNHFEVTLDGKVCMDVGASTGGFTDCMLQNGAVKVYSIDVDSLTGSFAMIPVWYVWKKQTSGMWFRKTFRSRRIFLPLTCPLFPLPRFFFL